ncbi:MAG: hypothetical protein R3236_01820, partial [Phycisphaeraceae bacterium]|nr:hypothetical protein [Phycisphaeraceae bacterium]
LAAQWSEAKADRQDGLRLDMPEGWIHARASNTEPIFRLIVEADDAQTARTWMAAARAAVTG